MCADRRLDGGGGGSTYPDLDARASSGAEPVAVGTEAESVDVVAAVQGVQVLAFIQVPQHRLAVLSKRCRSLKINNAGGGKYISKIIVICAGGVQKQPLLSSLQNRLQKMFSITTSTCTPPGPH